jgi:hypothetical protein
MKPLPFCFWQGLFVWKISTRGKNGDFGGIIKTRPNKFKIAEFPLILAESV